MGLSRSETFSGLSKNQPRGGKWPDRETASPRSDEHPRLFYMGVTPGGQSHLGLMCDAEKDWHERSFRASGAIESPLNEPEIKFFSLCQKKKKLNIFGYSSVSLRADSRHLFGRGSEPAHRL